MKVGDCPTINHMTGLKKTTYGDKPSNIIWEVNLLVMGDKCDS
jgi:hypothetical protein